MWPRQRFEIKQADRGWCHRLGWRTVDDVLAYSSRDVAAMSQSSDVVRVDVDPESGGPSSVYVKRYAYDSVGRRIKQMFRGTLFGKSRARVEYEFLHEMRRRGVPTARPIAYGDRRRGVFLHASFLMTEGADGMRSLDAFMLDRIRSRRLNPDERRTLTTAIASTIRRMHDAGVRHGGLFWRNILVRTRPGQGLDVELLDPDTHGRFFPGRVPDTAAIHDLSEFVASAMGLGLRRGIAELMRAYFHVKRLDERQRTMVHRILGRAKTLAPDERKRMTVTEMIEWLRNHVMKHAAPSPAAATFTSIDHFFHHLITHAADNVSLPDQRRTIRFTFSDDANQTGRVTRTLVIEHGRLGAGANDDAPPDLVIRADERTWLAVLAGHDDAFARVRSNPIHVVGDSVLLSVLLELIDAASQPPRANTAPNPDNPTPRKPHA
ncbi:MAG: lipopolysaccharide kinase InaA family protein [Phycisphaerae bacterium]